MLKLLNEKGGVSIYIGIMLMLIMLTIVFGLNNILTSQIKTVRNIGYSVVAYYAAETGIERALASSTCTSSCSFSEVLDLGGGNSASYLVSGISPGVSLCPAFASYCIKSIGTYSQTKRGIQVAR